MGGAAAVPGRRKPSALRSAERFAILHGIHAAKRPETRARRIAKAVEGLKSAPLMDEARTLVDGARRTSRASSGRAGAWSNPI
ncbi:MAG: YdeI/OmpD-associated family protein [Alphaproteobacteria bacterium]|nr:YdeI/OmpD-associated family protein [Alphaproteobacteria bacterium]